MIDIHSHILPGVDDGAKDMAMAEKMLVNAANNGIDAIICTPHNHQEGDEETRKSFELLKSKAATHGIRLLTGAEYDFGHIDNEGIKPTPLAGSSFLLVDFKGFPPPLGVVRNVVFNLSRHGCQVIVAHPERSFADWVYIEELHHLGMWFQLNAGSFLGKSGRKACYMARKMFKRGLCHYIASDDHDGTRVSHLRACRETLVKLGGEACVKTLMEENPERLLRNFHPRCVSPLSDSRFNLLSVFKGHR